jgi:hypothetical protein
MGSDKVLFFVAWRVLDFDLTRFERNLFSRVVVKKDYINIPKCRVDRGRSSACIFPMVGTLSPVSTIFSPERALSRHERVQQLLLISSSR